MNNTALILEKYKTGDFNDRIYLFLEYSDLRREFTDIDMNTHDSFKRKVSPKYHWKAGLLSMCNLKKIIQRVS
ncbi:MAG: hypothetical protein GY857_04830 [Desulfobacula sp.]|nr:hypothetical protein [Desulfobacula sp.]